MGHMYIFIPFSLYCDDLCLLSLWLDNRLCKLLSFLLKKNEAEGIGWTFFLISVVLLNFYFLFTLRFILTFLSFKKRHIEIIRTLILFFLSILSIKELHTITKERLNNTVWTRTSSLMLNFYRMTYFSDNNR